MIQIVRGTDPTPPGRPEDIRWPDGRRVGVLVRHWSRSVGYSMLPASIYDDLIAPWIAHCVNVHAYCGDSGICGCEGDKTFCDREIPVARVNVNEFPMHMIIEDGDDMSFVFDGCELGPSAQLGLVIDELSDQGVVDLTEPTGAVLHVQNLEVRSDLRRQGIGSQLLRYALTLIGRGEPDVIACETEPVRPVYKPLFPKNDRGFPEFDSSPIKEVRSFLEANELMHFDRDGFEG